MHRINIAGDASTNLDRIVIPIVKLGLPVSAAEVLRNSARHGWDIINRACTVLVQAVRAREFVNLDLKTGVNGDECQVIVDVAPAAIATRHGLDRITEAQEDARV